MKTSITTFQEKIQGNLEFPIMTDYGIIDDPDLGSYFRAQSALGNSLTTSQQNAFSLFLANARSEGWHDHILYALPFLVLIDKKSIAIPLVDKFADRQAMTIGVPALGYDAESDYDQFISPDSRGIISASGNKTLVSRLTGENMYKKHSAAQNRDSNCFGYTMVGDFNNIDENISRFWGYHVPSESIELYSGISGSGAISIALFSAAQGSSIPAVGSDIDNYNYVNFGTPVTGSSYNVRFEYGNVSGSIDENLSAQRTPTVITDFTTLSNARMAINSVWRGSLGSVVNNAPDFVMKFLLFHDGSIDDSAYPGYRPAIKTLLSTLGKI